MRRYIALMGVLALLGGALGCQHVAGKCDCGYNPKDYPIHQPTNPYPSAPVYQAPPATQQMPTPVPPTLPKSDGN